jgi:hypothetical protein
MEERVLPNSIEGIYYFFFKPLNFCDKCTYVAIVYSLHSPTCFGLNKPYSGILNQKVEVYWGMTIIEFQISSVTGSSLRLYSSSCPFCDWVSLKMAYLSRYM